jgi:hypothetical protein
VTADDTLLGREAAATSGKEQPDMAARGQGGGTTGFAVALVVFVILWVLTLAAAIVGWNQVNSAEKGRAEAVAKQQQADTKAGKEHDTLRKFGRIITGSEETNLKNITDQLEQRGLNTGDSLLTLVEQAQRERDSKVKEIDSLNKQLADAREQRTVSQKELTQLKPDYEKAVAALQTQVDTIQKQFDDFKKFSDDQLKGLQAETQTKTTNNEKTIADLQDAVAQRDTKVRELNKQIEELKRPTVKTAVGVDPSTLPKGEVTALAPGDQVVYINRGWADHLPLGITFEVYDRNTPISKDQDGILRGKATIEVIRVQEHSASARVVRQVRGTTLEEGDVLGNVAYDPHMVFKFVVFGDFDVDHTGQAQPGDNRRVENMIGDWGAKVVDKLNYDTDFLVLGLEPQMPEPLKGDDALDHIKIQQYDAAKAKFQRYQNLLGEANGLHIPVLNQNRFLALVGYYQRMPGGTLRHQ